MSITEILFWMLSAITLFSALMVVISRNPVYSVLWLIVTFFTISGHYILLNAQFLAIVNIIVYAGAIMVLFLFVIMLLGTEQLAPTDNLPWQRPVALILAAALVVEAVYVFFFRRTLPEAVVQALPDGFGGPVNIGEVLFNQYLLPFEVTSVILLVAMIGAIVLSRRT